MSDLNIIFCLICWLNWNGQCSIQNIYIWVLLYRFGILSVQYANKFLSFQLTLVVTIKFFWNICVLKNSSGFISIVYLILQPLLLSTWKRLYCHLFVILSTNLLQNCNFVSSTTFFYGLVIQILENVTEGGPPVENLSTCFWTFEFNLKVFSVVNLRNKCLNISFEYNLVVSFPREFYL